MKKRRERLERVEGTNRPAATGILVAALILLASSGDLSAPSLSLARAASGAQPEQGGQQFSGSLDVRVHPPEGKREPPVRLLLTDPRQRRTGWDPHTKQRIKEIAGSSDDEESIADDIGGEPGPTTMILHVANPVPGEYDLRVSGLEAGRYTLEIQALDRAMAPSRATFIDVKVAAGAVHQYRIRYSNAPGAKVEVEAVSH